jgi:GH25 family lysozyme M1 (1,4-beta-N-acetylmuramidase)
VIRAIDVSIHQGPIDWAAVKASGVQAAWVKVGGADGGHYRDGRAGTNLAGVEAAGIPYGTYYFCSPAPGNAVDQARHAVTCGHGRGQLWPAADLEINPVHMSNEQLDVWLGQFCAEVARQTGRESLWYGNFNTGVGFTTRAPSCPCWIANYGTNRPGTTPPAFTPRVPPHWSGWDIWQFNSETRVPGITDNTVDQNVVSDAFWARMTTSAPTADKPNQEDDEMLTIYWTTPGSQWVADVAHVDNSISQGFAVEGRFARPIGEKARPGHEGWDPRTDAVRGMLALLGFAQGFDARQREADVPDSVMRTLCLLPDALTGTAAPALVDVDEAAIVTGLIQYLEANGIEVDLSKLDDLTERLAAAGRALVGASQG